MVFDCTSQTSFKSFRIITTSTLVTRTSTSSPLSREATPTTTKRSTLLSIHLLSSYEITFSTTTMLTSVTPIPSPPSCENNTRNQTDRLSIYIPNSFYCTESFGPYYFPHYQYCNFNFYIPRVRSSEKRTSLRRQHCNSHLRSCFPYTEITFSEMRTNTPNFRPPRTTA